MAFPTPEDPAGAPAWTNYVIAQTSFAALGHIPTHALALGVEVVGRRARLVFQLTEASPQDVEDIEEIKDNLEVATGSVLDVETEVQIVPYVNLSSERAVAWVYREHVKDEPDADG